MNNKDIIVFDDPIMPGVEVKIENQWIEDSVYAQIVEKTIITCTDTVFVIPGDTAIYLAKRSVLPMKGVWCFGGRMFFNDKTPQDSVSRCIKTETGLLIDPSRFVFVCMNLYSWVVVAQGNFPGRNLGITHMCYVNYEEIKQMLQRLNSSEYDMAFGIQRFDRDRLIHENVHKALLRIFDEIFLG